MANLSSPVEASPAARAHGADDPAAHRARCAGSAQIWRILLVAGVGALGLLESLLWVGTL